MPICSKETAAERKLQREKTDCILKTKTKHAIARSNVARCWSERSSRRISRRLLEDTWRPWIFIIIASLCNFCDYYVIIISHSYVASMRGQKFCYICFGYASFVLNVVCLLSLWFSFCGRLFGAYIGISYCGNCLQTFYTVSQQMGNQITISGSIKSPHP